MRHACDVREAAKRAAPNIDAARLIGVHQVRRHRIECVVTTAYNLHTPSRYVLRKTREFLLYSYMFNLQTLSLESDHFICIREKVNDQAQVVIIDLSSFLIIPVVNLCLDF